MPVDVLARAADLRPAVLSHHPGSSPGWPYLCHHVANCVNHYLTRPVTGHVINDESNHVSGYTGSHRWSRSVGLPGRDTGGHGLRTLHGDTPGCCVEVAGVPALLVNALPTPATSWTCALSPHRKAFLQNICTGTSGSRGVPPSRQQGEPLHAKSPLLSAQRQTGRAGKFELHRSDGDCAGADIHSFCG